MSESTNLTHRPRCVLLAGLIAGISCLCSSSPATEVAEPASGHRPQSGLLIVNGKFIRLPVTLKAVDGGLRIEPSGDVYQYRMDSAGNEHESQDDSFRGRRKRRNGRGARRPEESIAGDIEEALRFGEIAILFDAHPPVILPSATAERVLCEELLAASPDERRLAELFAGIPSTTWKDDLLSLNADAGTRSWMQSRRDSILATQESNDQSIQAVQLLNQFQYPLTVIGMFLGVLTLGHMLKWTARGLDDTGDSQKMELSIRSAVIGIYFLLALSALDLTWTILASQAGLMTEVNPLAAGLVNTPIKLAGFKVFATLLACGILYFWRHRKQIQQATWWMCLVCVLLTFRWVVVDSLVQ